MRCRPLSAVLTQPLAARPRLRPPAQLLGPTHPRNAPLSVPPRSTATQPLGLAHSLTLPSPIPPVSYPRLQLFVRNKLLDVRSYYPVLAPPHLAENAPPLVRFACTIQPPPCSGLLSSPKVPRTIRPWALRSTLGSTFPVSRSLPATPHPHSAPVPTPTLLRTVLLSRGLPVLVDKASDDAGSRCGNSRRNGTSRVDGFSLQLWLRAATAPPGPPAPSFSERILHPPQSRSLLPPRLNFARTGVPTPPRSPPPPWSRRRPPLSPAPRPGSFYPHPASPVPGPRPAMLPLPRS